jgi:hypothetical protein
METVKSPEVMLAYKNRNSSLTYPTELINKDFTLPLTFSSAPILSELNALPDAFLDQQLYNDAIMTAEI